MLVRRKNERPFFRQPHENMLGLTEIIREQIEWRGGDHCESSKDRKIVSCRIGT
jgi:hypothetical protein